MIKNLHKFLILAALFLPSAVIAAELKYFEFSPYAQNFLTPATAETAYQTFIPFDDYVIGLDFWVENLGSSGTAAFSLLNSNNAVLASKTVTIPQIGKEFGGHRFHVKFNSAVKINSQETYKIRITSSMPQLKFFYANGVELRLHNASNVLEKQVGPLYLGGEVQPFSLKFALYEDGDISAPVISNLNILVPSADKARITFNTTEPVDYKISYWVSGETNKQETSYYGNYFTCQEGLNNCILEIPVLTDKTYNFELFAKDIWGNEAKYQGFFISQPGWTGEGENSTSTDPENPLEDQTPPIISDVQTVALSQKSIKIYWRTDEAANSSLLIGLDQPGAQVLVSLGDSDYELEHLMTADNALAPDKRYYASLISIDPSGNNATHRFIFNTLPESLVKPEILEEENDNQNNTGTSTLNPPAETNKNNPSVLIEEEEGLGTAISWTGGGTIPQNGYRVDIFGADKKLRKQIISDSDRTLAGDLPVGDYYAVVYKNNDGIFEKVAKAQDFSVVKKESFAEKISKNAMIYLGGFGAVILAIAGVSYAVKRKKKSNEIIQA